MPSPVTLAATFAIKTSLATAAVGALFIAIQSVQVQQSHFERQILERAAATIDCSHFKPGFYDDVADPILSFAITDTVQKADHSYSWKALRRPDVRRGIASILRSDTRNNLLVVSAPQLDPDEFESLRDFGAASGCKRLLIVGRYSSGPVVVLFDETYSKH